MKKRLLGWIGWKLYWWSRWCWDRAGGPEAWDVRAGARKRIEKMVRKGLDIAARSGRGTS